MLPDPNSVPPLTGGILSTLLSALSEKVGNYLLQRTPDREKWLRPLNGKVLALGLKQQPPLTFILFAKDQIDLVSQYAGEVDCRVSADFALLQRLVVGDIPQKQELSDLINQQQIILEGDLAILQHFMALLTAIEKDPAELLSPYLGDVIAHTTVNFLQQGRSLLQQKLQQSHQFWGERLSEEWQVVAPKLALIDFADQVAELGQQLSRLEQKIAQLEQ